MKYLLKSFNMTLKSLQDLILSFSPASSLNFPLTLCTLTHWSLGSLAFHYSFYHRPFMYATSRLVSLLHTSVPDSVPQRSLLDLLLQVTALHYTLMGKYVFLWEDLAGVYNYTFRRVLYDKYLLPHPPICSQLSTGSMRTGPCPLLLTISSSVSNQPLTQNKNN